MASSKKKRSTSKTKKTTKAAVPAPEKALAKADKPVKAVKAKADTKPAKATAKKQTSEKATAKSVAKPKITEKPATKVIDKPRFNAFAWNKWLAIIFAIQAIAILVVSATKTLPVTLSFLTQNPIADSNAMVSASHHLFDLDVAWLVAAFLFTAAIAHTLLATTYRKRYEAELVDGVNTIRWIEYGLSSAIVLVAVAMLGGVRDLGSLLLLAALMVTIHILSLATELYNRGGKVATWLPFRVNLGAGFMVWAVPVLYLIGSAVYGDGSLPGYIYWVFATGILSCTAFAALQYLHTKQQGKWADYVYTERAYMLLSVTAKTLIAWQIFAGALRP